MLAATLTPWVLIANDVARILLASPSGRRYFFEEFQRFDPEPIVQQKADLLGEDGMEKFLGAFESLQGISEWALPKLDKGGADAQAVSLMEGLAGPTLLRAQIVVAALFLILYDIVTDWRPEAIPLLCSAADDYMTEVEDIFLAVSPTEEESETGTTV